MLLPMLTLIVAFAAAPDDAAKVVEAEKVDGEKKDVEEKLTLERLFPEKSFFGPSARGMAFSRDGRFAAFLYAPYLERRHGEDLYLFDTRNGQMRRITSVGRLAEFDAEARKVKEDREAKAKKSGVTLGALAAEQHDELAERLGWKDGWVLGTWAGEARVDAAATGPLAAGESRLTLTQGKGGVITGELRVGLVRLPVKDGTYDDAKRALKATIADASLKVDGELLLAFADGVLKGTVSIKVPAQRLNLSFTQAKAEPEDPKKKTPRGVIGSIGERLTLADVVSANDATINDEKDGKPPKDPAPRYSGVSSFEWLPWRLGPNGMPVDTSSEDAAKAEMLVMIDGDVYRLTIDTTKWEASIAPPAAEASKDVSKEVPSDGATDAKPEAAKLDPSSPNSKKPSSSGAADGKKPTQLEFKPSTPYLGELIRLTRTRERESDVQYLPDATGYTYLRNNALLRVTFDSSEIVQLDPELKDGERMVGYRISPDQKRLVFLATRGAPGAIDSGGRSVTIVNYRERFAKAVDVPRRMPDDAWPESYSSVYLYDLGKHQSEDGQLERVFTKRVSGPRDVIRVPEWSPDSSRVAFAAFEQATGQIKILEAGFAAETDKDKKEKAKAKDEDDGKEGEGAKKEGDASETNSDLEPQEQKRETKRDGTQKDGTGRDETNKDDTKQDDSKKDDGAKPASGKKPDADKPEFKIENAKVVYQFLHAGGPSTPSMIAPLYLPDSRRMAFITELSGFRQLHVLDPRYEELTQVTHGKCEVHPFHQSADGRTLYYTSTEIDPAQDHIYSIDLETRQIKCLSKDSGTYSRVAVRDDGSYVLASHVDFGALRELVAITAPGVDTAAMTRFTDSHPYEAFVLTRVSPEYFSYENRHGQEIHGHMFKPKDWKPTDKRPLLLFVYGGPLGERNMAARGSFDSSGYFFARYMAETHGYVTATVDPRGVSGYGAVFEKANFEQVGKPQTEDLVDGARWFAKNHGVDEKRMALHGWSFGGFQTQMVMYTEPEVFAAGIAGAGPTEWQNYNAWYSTGTVGKNEPGKVELEKYSLLPLAKNLKGKLLLVHGMEDSNVLFQDTVRVYRELLKAKKQTQVELFVDPTGGHSLGGDVKSFGRFSKYEEFLLRTIGRWETPKVEQPKEEKPADEKEAAKDEQPTGDKVSGTPSFR